MFAEMADRPFRAFAGLVVCIGGVLAYANTFTGDFVWDDASSILVHEHVKDPSKIFALFTEDQHAFGRGQGTFYRPLVSVSFMLDYQLSHPGPTSKPSPLLFHATNLAWHLLASILLLALLARIEAPRFVQFAAPLVYVVHPLHTEAVSYISGRADSMAATFMFAATLLLLRDGEAGKSVLWTLSGALCAAAALLCKESALIFPAILAIFMLAAPPRTEHARGFRLAGVASSLAVVAVYVLLRATVLKFESDSLGPQSTFLGRLVETGQAFALYIGLTIWPQHLHMERTLTDAPGWLSVLGYVLLAGNVALATLSWLWGKRRIAAGLTLFLATWLPISGLFPLNAPMAEHWLYIPLAGVVWAVAEAAWMLPSFRGKNVVLATATYAVCVALMGVTVDRNRDWRNNESIFLATLTENPDTIRVHFNLAVTYEDILENVPAARRHFEKVLELHARKKKAHPELADQLWADEMEAHVSLGDIYFEAGDVDAAGRHYAEVAGIEPEGDNRPIWLRATLGLGRCYLASNRPDLAGELLAKAAERAPEAASEIDSIMPGLLEQMKNTG